MLDAGNPNPFLLEMTFPVIKGYSMTPVKTSDWFTSEITNYYNTDNLKQYPV